jgi:hypothetical protein
MIAKLVFKKQIEDPKPVMRAGMLLLAIALVWPRFVPVTGNLGADAVDGIKGLLIGMSIALNLWSLRLGARLRHSGRTH